MSAYAEILPSVVWYVAHSQQQHAGCEVGTKRNNVTKLHHCLTLCLSLSADPCVRSTEGEAEQPP